MFGEYKCKCGRTWEHCECVTQTKSPSSPCSFRSLIARKLWAERRWYNELPYECKSPHIYGKWQGRMEILRELAGSNLAEKNAEVTHARNER